MIFTNGGPISFPLFFSTLGHRKAIRGSLNPTSFRVKSTSSDRSEKQYNGLGNRYADACFFRLKLTGARRLGVAICANCILCGSVLLG
jgi:hypothetical protein